MRATIKVIALDLEGTLVSNAMSQIPRPGLFTFLEGCAALAGEVVAFTTVREPPFREVAGLLVKEQLAPPWFETIRYVEWQGKTKNLEHVQTAAVEECLLVDDYEVYVHPGQESQWVPIAEFQSPYPDDDRELEKTLATLRQRAAG
ncbi:MAG: NIF family HAD-type phosphatase [Pseudomonadota bacterium]